MAKPWYFQVMGAEIGPLTSAELMEKVQMGQIQPDTLVRSGKDGKWVPADRWKGLLPSKAEKPDSVAAPEKKAPAAKADKTNPAAAATTEATTANSIPINEEDDPLYHLKGEAAAGAPVPFSHPDEYDFFQFVGFRHAITHPLYDAVVIYSHQHQLTVTQITRQAIAKFISKPELGEDKPPPGSEPANSESKSTEPPEEEIKLAD